MSAVSSGVSSCSLLVPKRPFSRRSTCLLMANRASWRGSVKWVASGSTSLDTSRRTTTVTTASTSLVIM